jgi:hypothetical protein
MGERENMITGGFSRLRQVIGEAVEYGINLVVGGFVPGITDQACFAGIEIAGGGVRCITDTFNGFEYLPACLRADKGILIIQDVGNGRNRDPSLARYIFNRRHIGWLVAVFLLRWY